jgi:hypothetical protein
LSIFCFGAIVPFRGRRDVQSAKKFGPTDGEGIMRRSIAITLAAVAAMAAASALSSPATARGSGFGGHAGSVGHFASAHSSAFNGGHFASRHGFRHRFFGPGFAFYDVPYGYYDDYCYQRVWTSWGWRWVSACY